MWLSVLPFTPFFSFSHKKRFIQGQNMSTRKGFNSKNILKEVKLYIKKYYINCKKTRKQKELQYTLPIGSDESTITAS